MLGFLESIPLFKSLDSRQIKKLSEIAIEKTYRKGTLIFTVQDRANGFYILRSGRIKVFHSRDGKEQIIKLFHPPATFGEAGTLAGENFPANAEAAENSTVIYIPRDALMDQMKKDPGIAINLLSITSKRLIHLSQLIENLSLKNAESKLAHYIIKNKNENGEIKFKTTVVSMELGLTPETVSRTLSKFKSKGLINKHKHKIKILNMELLEKYI